MASDEEGCHLCSGAGRAVFWVRRLGWVRGVLPGAVGTLRAIDPQSTE